MEQLINRSELRAILERGLTHGLWSIIQFNKGIVDVILPSKGFLEDNPVFLDMDYRDLEAFEKQGHRGLFG
jgi:hypothetical protein